MLESVALSTLASFPINNASPRHQRPMSPLDAPCPTLPEACPLEPALRFLAGTWTVKIMYYLDCAPRGFAELQRDLGRVSPKVLSDRLKQMEARGVITRSAGSGRRGSVIYALTPFGQRFKPVLKSLCEVAQEMATA
jgi:DNA-binding HxlR family transcriptional regulator